MKSKSYIILDTIYKEIKMELTAEFIEQLKSYLSTASVYNNLVEKYRAIKKLITKSLEMMLEAKLSFILPMLWKQFIVNFIKLPKAKLFHIIMMF